MFKVTIKGELFTLETKTQIKDLIDKNEQKNILWLRLIIVYVN